MEEDVRISGLDLHQAVHCTATGDSRQPPQLGLRTRLANSTGSGGKCSRVVRCRCVAGALVGAIVTITLTTNTQTQKCDPEDEHLNPRIGCVAAPGCVSNSDRHAHC